MQQADATRIAALCDQQIEALLRPLGPLTEERANIIFGLADLRNMYAGAPDLSELTPQTASLYGDGTPGNISVDTVVQHDFKIGEVVNFKRCDRDSRAGIVDKISLHSVFVIWSGNHDASLCWPEELRHGP